MCLARFLDFLGSNTLYIMKKLILIVIAAFVGITSYGQAYNPFTQNIHYSPEPTALGIQNCGPIDAKFTMGMTTAEDATDWVNNPLVVKICVSGFVLRASTADSAVYGPYARFFNWSIDSTGQCVIGVQKDTLHGTGSDPFNIHPDASDTIGIKLIIPAALPVPSTAGVDITLTVPPYMDTFNTPSDDPESSFTQNYIGVTSVRGTLYDDTDTGDDPLGTPSGTPDNTNMYVNVVDSATGLVEGSNVIDTSGHYLVDSLTVNRTYTIQLSTIQGTKGQSPPPVQLPPGWGFTDEDCCDSFSNDGLPNGLLVDIQATTCPIIWADFGISNTVFLGVNQLDFNAANYNCNGLLTWAKTEEYDVHLYEILRKEGNSDYSKIGEVKANAGLSRYSYVDRNIEKENKNYSYQLRITDNANRIYFSPTLNLNLNCSGEDTRASLYPNPAKGNIHFLYDNRDNLEAVSLTIVDVAGKSLYSEVLDINQGQNDLTIDIANLPAGYYMLKYNSLENQDQGSLKFTIK